MTSAAQDDRHRHDAAASRASCHALYQLPPRPQAIQGRCADDEIAMLPKPPWWALWLMLPPSHTRRRGVAEALLWTVRCSYWARRDDDRGHNGATARWRVDFRFRTRPRRTRNAVCELFIIGGAATLSRSTDRCRAAHMPFGDYLHDCKLKTALRGRMADRRPTHHADPLRAEANDRTSARTRASNAHSVGRAYRATFRTFPAHCNTCAHFCKPGTQSVSLLSAQPALCMSCTPPTALITPAQATPFSVQLTTEGPHSNILAACNAHMVVAFLHSHSSRRAAQHSGGAISSVILQVSNMARAALARTQPAAAARRQRQRGGSGVRVMAAARSMA